MSARDSSNYSSGRAPILSKSLVSNDKYLDTDSFTSGFRLKTDEEMGQKIDNEFLESMHSEKNDLNRETIDGREFDKKEWEYLDLIHHTELGTDVIRFLGDVIFSLDFLPTKLDLDFFGSHRKWLHDNF